MMTPAERYQRDPEFRILVDVITDAIRALFVHANRGARGRHAGRDPAQRTDTAVALERFARHGGSMSASLAWTPTPPSPLDASQRIRTWRHRVGYTSEELAHALGMTFSTVSRWENGHSRPSRLAWRILQQLAAEREIPL